MISLEEAPNSIPYGNVTHEWILEKKKSNFVLWSIKQFLKRTKWKKDLFTIWLQYPVESDVHRVMGKIDRGEETHRK